MNFRFLLLILLIGLFASCDRSKASVEEPPVPVERVVLVYMEARNNLSDEALADIDEMRRGEIPVDGRLLVYKSRKGENHPVLMEIYAGGDSVLKGYADTAYATDPAHMARVIADVRSLAPSKEFGIVFWSHASGWRQKAAPALESRGFGSELGNAMTITDLAAALGRERKIDFIFFDCCYMGCAEVAYELRNAARYFVASVCEVPAGGMPYQLTVGELFNPAMEQGLKNAIDLNVDYYLDRPQEKCPSTMSLVDLTKMDQLLDSVRPTVGKFNYNQIWQRFSRSEPYKHMFTDLGQYLEVMEGPAIPEGLILHERHTASVWGVISLNHCSGLSIYYPEFSLGDPYNYTYKGYDTLEWAKTLGLNASIKPETP